MFLPILKEMHMDIDVRTQQGVMRGRIVEGVATFKGIPYAAPPFGANRFQPPRPAERWDGVREALSYGPTVPKPPYFPPFDVLIPEPAISGEDCLNLNIWTPDVEVQAVFTGYSWLRDKY